MKVPLRHQFRFLALMRRIGRPYRTTRMQEDGATVWTTETKPFSQDLEADSVQALEELEQDPVLRFISFGSISWPVEWLERIWHYVGRKVIGRSVSGINQNAGVVAFAGVIVGAIGIAVALLR